MAKPGDDYEDHRALAIEKWKILDHWLLTASLGSFGLSFVFLKDLGNNSLWLLLLGWYYFGANTLIVLLTYYISAEVDVECITCIQENQKFNLWGLSHEGIRKILNHINKLTLLLFAIGIILSMIFATKNVLNRESKRELNEVKPAVFITNYYYGR